MGKRPQQTTIVQQAPPVPEAVAPVTPTATEVVKANMDLRQQQSARKGFKSTIHAGDSGGFRPGGGGKMASGVGGNPFVPPQGKF